MERKRVSSSTIRAIGYEAASQTLEVEFNNGSVMQYTRVPAELHRRLMSASSITSFFTDHIEEDFTARRIR